MFYQAIKLLCNHHDPKLHRKAIGWELVHQDRTESSDLLRTYVSSTFVCHLLGTF